MCIVSLLNLLSTSQLLCREIGVAFRLITIWCWPNSVSAVCFNVDWYACSTLSSFATMSFTSTVVLAYPPIMEENKSAEYINMSTVQKIRTILRKNNLERKISSNNHLPTDKLSGRDRKISSVSSGSRNRAGSESSSFVGSSSSYLYLILPIELY